MTKPYTAAELYDIVCDNTNPSIVVHRGLHAYDVEHALAKRYGTDISQKMIDRFPSEINGYTHGIDIWRVAELVNKEAARREQERATRIVQMGRGW